MKFLKLFIVFISLSVLSSCVDIDEQIVVNADNSGTYTLTMDLGKMVAMIKQMGEGSGTGSKLETKDSLIRFSNLFTEASDLTAEERELFKDATLRIKMDKEKDEVKMIMFCPFSSIARLPDVKNNFQVVAKKLNIFEKASGKEESSNYSGSNEEDNAAQKMLTPGANDLKFTAKPGLIENTVTDVQHMKTELSSDSTMQTIKQLMTYIGEPKYMTTIKMYKEIRSYKGNSAVLSPDKRSVTFSSTFTEMMEEPDKMGYKVEY